MCPSLLYQANAASQVLEAEPYLLQGHKLPKLLRAFPDEHNNTEISEIYSSCGKSLIKISPNESAAQEVNETFCVKSARRLECAWSTKSPARALVGNGLVHKAGPDKPWREGGFYHQTKTLGSFPLKANLIGKTSFSKKCK